jgi:hypothetical protein
MYTYSLYIRSLSFYIYLSLYILTAEEEQAPMQQWGLRAGETVAVDAYPHQEREGRACMGLTPGITHYLHAHVAGQAVCVCFVCVCVCFVCVCVREREREKERERERACRERAWA